MTDRRITAVGVVVLVVALSGCVSSSPDEAAPPATIPTTVPAADPKPVRAAVVTARFHHADYRAAASAPRLEVRHPVPLADDPVRRAVLAVVPSPATLRGDARWTTIAVLGTDGRWRSVDVPGLVPTRDAGGYEWYPLSPTSLSVDGTRLALAQPQGLVVVDLTTGRHRRYTVPGFNQSAVWRDDEHVLLSVEERPTMSMVDLDTGAVAPADVEPPPWSLDGGINETVPLADDRVVVGLGVDGMRNGVVVVDRATGDVLGFRTGMISKGDFTQLLGLDARSVLISVVKPRSLDRLLVRWYWAEKRSDVVATMAAAMASWAGPVSGVAPAGDGAVAHGAD